METRGTRGTRRGRSTGKVMCKQNGEEETHKDESSCTGGNGVSMAKTHRRRLSINVAQGPKVMLCCGNVGQEVRLIST